MSNIREKCTPYLQATVIDEKKKLSGSKGLNSSIDLLSAVFKSKKPLGKLFKTDSAYYFYDTGTNKILNCDKPIFSLFEKLYSFEFSEAIDCFIAENGENTFIETTSCIKESICKHNLLGLYNVTNFDLFCNKQELKETIETKSHILGLEVTEKCNLRCLYCVHKDDNREYRPHGNKNMGIDTALAAVDYLEKHSKDPDELVIVFYGGEPLLNLPVIKHSIKYSKEIFPNRKVSFSMTTNGINITPGIARYFFDNDVSVKVSIDGPAIIHDRYRKNFSGKGSYKETIRGLKNLYEVYGDLFKHKISLNMVYAPPFSLEQLEKRAALWDDLGWLPDDIAASISYYTGPRLPGIDHNEDKNLLQWAFDEYINNKLMNHRPHPLSTQLIEKSMAVLSQRPLYKEVVNKFPLNGCCIPGVRRIFVSASGDFRLCERIPISAPVIGNVKTGIDLDLLYKVYIKEYSEMSLKVCKNCWAINICESCFVDGFDSNGISYEKRTRECQKNLLSAEKQIYYFIKTSEIMPDLIKHFQSIKLK